MMHNILLHGMLINDVICCVCSDQCVRNSNSQLVYNHWQQLNQSYEYGSGIYRMAGNFCGTKFLRWSNIHENKNKIRKLGILVFSFQHGKPASANFIHEFHHQHFVLKKFLLYGMVHGKTVFISATISCCMI